MFERVAVVGVGLIGGSFALALKQAGACRHVVGVGRSPENLRTALARGAIDSTSTGVSGCDRVLVATPVAQFPAVFERLATQLAPDAVVTDGGSTKRDVIDAARRALGPRIGQFVPAHPIAGAEKSGAAAASAELFRDRRVVLTPLAENSAAMVDRVDQAWQACGARTSRMSPQAHDEVLGAVSHLPHLLAFALVHEIAGRPNAEELFSFAAGGFRDFTRIASSHPEMWRDICVANRDRMLEEVSRFSRKLDEVKALLDEPARLEALFAEARTARDAWLKRSS